MIDDRRRMKRAGAVRTGARERVPISVSATTAGRALSLALVISANVTLHRPASSSSVIGSGRRLCYYRGTGSACAARLIPASSLRVRCGADRPRAPRARRLCLPLSLPQSPSLHLFSSISSCTLRARRLAPCGVSPPGLLPVRAPSVVSHHLRRLSPPLLASRAHSIGFR